ncbi:MAG TPA: DUF692 family protein [Polyangiaceae bacterium]|nr:DUF692 family protein [Polyangiaceae bacterium]
MSFPFLGHGVGLRLPHYQRALAGGLEVDWVEVVSENFFGGGGRPRAVLEAVRRERPLVLHGVSLGIGSIDPPSASYLRRLRELEQAFEPAWISDHACWTRVEGRESHELLPLPFTEEALALAVDNTQRVQDVLGRPLVLENVSSYVRYAHSQLSEWEFLAELARRSGCSLLLDLNNVLVSAYNHGFSPEAYLDGLPADRVVQFHLANHTQHAHHKFDDHRGPVPEAVWALYEAALRRFGAVSSLVEWDEDVPAWERLVAERDQAAERARRVLAERTSEPPRNEPARSGPSAPTAAPSAHASAAAESRAAALGERSRPPALRETQRLFFAALAWPRGVEDLAAHDAAARCELERTFITEREGAPFERLELYANAYFYRQLDALRETFPRLARLAGDVGFHDLITDYVLEHPSNDPDLHHRGGRLPAFLRGHPLGQQPLLVELAELELAIAQALDAPDGEPLARADLARLAPHDWPGLVLQRAASAHVLQVSHDLEAAVRCCDDAEPASALQVRRLEAAALIVYRREQRVFFRMLAPAEALALDVIDAGARFDALCERLGESGMKPAAILALLERWVDDGVVQRRA